MRLDGSYRVEPKSISFANMDQEEFERLYSETLNVLLKHVYKQKISQEELEEIVNKYMEFM